MMKSFLFPKQTVKSSPGTKPNPSATTHAFHAKRFIPPFSRAYASQLHKNKHKITKIAPKSEQEKLSDEYKTILNKLNQLKKYAKRINKSAFNNAKIINDFVENLAFLKNNNYFNHKKLKEQLTSLEAQVQNIQEQTGDNYLELIALQKSMMEQISALNNEVSQLKNELRDFNKNYTIEIPENIISDQLNKDDFAIVDKQAIKSAITKFSELFSILGSLVALVTLIYQHKQDVEQRKTKQKDEVEMKSEEIRLIDKKMNLLLVNLQGVNGIINLLERAKDELSQEKLKLQYKTIFGTFFHKNDRLNQVNDALRDVDIQLAKQQKKRMDIEAEIHGLGDTLVEKGQKNATFSIEEAKIKQAYEKSESSTLQKLTLNR